MKEFKCDECDKVYKHKQSLHRHKKQVHISENNDEIVEKIDENHNVSINVSNLLASEGSNVSPMLAFSENEKNEINPIINEKNRNVIFSKCIYCKKFFKHRSSKSRQQLVCKAKKEVKMIPEEQMNIKIEEIKEEMLNLMNKNFKVHHKTFEKMRRQLKAKKTINNNMNNSHNTINTNSNNTNNIQQNIHQNTINIIPLGKEEFINNLDKKSQIAVVNSMYNAIKHLCNITHFNPKTPQYLSFVITNTQNNIAYSYDDDENDYKTITKTELMEELVHERINDIRDFMEYNEDDIKPSIIVRMNNFIDRLDTDRLYFKKKCNELKVLVYDKTKDVDINRFKNLKLLT